MKINYYQINREFDRIKVPALKVFREILSNGKFILGKHLKKFEDNISKIIGCNYTIGVSNGTDAIEIALAAENIPKGSEIITTSNTFIATVNAIINYGCKPVFADIDETFNIDPKKIENIITKKTSAIIPVHLNGMPACLKKINSIAKKYKLKVIEDTAQSILSKYNGRVLGNGKNLSCFSLHPTKNLGGISDGGFITTNDRSKYKIIKYIRDHGLAKRGVVKLPGRNSRLSEINAAILNLKIKYIYKDLENKIKFSKMYDRYLSDKLIKPYYGCCRGVRHTFHRYVIRVNKNRDKLLKYLHKNGIEAKVHYEKNIHDQIKFKKYLRKNQKLHLTDQITKQTISLPINQFLKLDEIKYIIKKINFFMD